ncbi:hypothetical protein PENARI_c005G02996 [Penicillium arizonense]|uniref:Uncharacterized protein n=1 Tax=Penicillium arizonense TaxID=1835702 RepID=A0A1F5LP45_PENAI|nr:hypothetical protein PENARI_c005G02996 [Penicillium arizonense]OGE54984.1 hypothetical protein PENARI_c005G02996 [Penicillium arizonense]
MMNFPGVALVTGAASGIGKATALQYAADDCQRIVIADINFDDLMEVEMLIKQQYQGVEIKRIAVDVRDQASVETMVQEAVKTFGRIDYCANVAGIIRFGDTTVLPIEDFDLVYQVNLRGIFLCTKAQINQMLHQEPDSPFPSRGAICNISSEAGMMGNGDLPAYVAAKHGVVGLSRSDGVKFAARGIRVNALCPGTIETPILGDLPQGEAGAKRIEERTKDIALGRKQFRDWNDTFCPWGLAESLSNRR